MDISKLPTIVSLGSQDERLQARIRRTEEELKFYQELPESELRTKMIERYEVELAKYQNQI